MNKRKAFERWCRDGLSDNLTQRMDGNYQEDEVQLAWDAWQAATKAERRRHASTVDAQR